jgi:hypothetical protein
MASPTSSLTIRSPSAQDTQRGASRQTGPAGGLPRWQKRRRADDAGCLREGQAEEDKGVENEPITVETSGGSHQTRLRSRSKIDTSSSCAIRKAEPEAIAIRGVASQIDSATAMMKPMKTTIRALRTEAAVGKIGDQKRHRIGESAPCQKIGQIERADGVIDRELHKVVRGDDDGGHDGHERQYGKIIRIFLSWVDATSRNKKAGLAPAIAMF